MTSINTKCGFNITPGGYFANRLLIDLIKTSDTRWWDSGTITTTGIAANNWIDSMATGKTYNSIVFTGDQLDVLPVGQYYVKYTPKANVVITAQLDGPFTANVNSSNGKYGFTLNSPTTSGTLIGILVTNNTGANVSYCGNNIIQMYYYGVDANTPNGNEAALAADPYAFAPEMIDSLCSPKSIRAMAIIGSNEMGYGSGTGSAPVKVTLELSDFIQLTDRTFAGGGPTQTWQPGYPPKILANLAKQLNADLDFPLPARFTFTGMQNVAAEIASVGGTFKVYTNVNNETWNFSDPYYKNQQYYVNEVANTIINYHDDGTTVSYANSSFYEKVSCAMSHKNAQSWAAFESVLGRGRVIRTMAGQGGYFDPLSPSFEYIVPAGIDATYTGKRIKDLLGSGGVYEEAFYLYPQPGNYTGNTISTSNLVGLEFNINGVSNTTIKDMLTNYYYITTKPTIIDAQNRVVAKNAYISLATYESGLDFSFWSFDKEPVYFYSNTINNTMTLADNYSPNTSYYNDNLIVYGGNFYLSKINNNTGNTPVGITNTNWTLLGPLSGWLTNGENIQGQYFGTLKPFSNTSPTGLGAVNLTVNVTGNNVLIFDPSFYPANTLNVITATAQTPTYVNANTFTLVGDQSSLFSGLNRLRFTVTSGKINGSIVSSVFNNPNTTITMVMDSTPLDSGLSAVTPLYPFQNYTRRTILMDKVVLFMNSQEHADLTKFKWLNIFRGKRVNWQHLNATAGWSYHYGFFWGLKQDQFLPDNPAVRFFKSLKYKGAGIDNATPR